MRNKGRPVSGQLIETEKVNKSSPGQLTEREKETQKKHKKYINIFGFLPSPVKHPSSRQESGSGAAARLTTMDGFPGSVGVLNRLSRV
jgi:hypothetical protein